jgi:hypothetical protein
MKPMYNLFKSGLKYLGVLSVTLPFVFGCGKDVVDGSFKHNAPLADKEIPFNSHFEARDLNGDGHNVSEGVGAAPYYKHSRKPIFYVRIDNGDGTFKQSIWEVESGRLREFILEDLDSDWDLDAKMIFDNDPGCFDVEKKWSITATNDGDGNFDLGDRVDIQ